MTLTVMSRQLKYLVKTEEMRILIFGGTGMLGHKLAQTLAAEHEVYITVRGGFAEVSKYGIFNAERTIGSVSATDIGSVRTAIERAKPDVVINAIGVIKQLPTSKDVIATLATNSIFPHELEQLGREFGFRLICISTDCVFDGKKGNYTENETPNALDLYGQSKHWGEVNAPNCLTMRTSIIGRELGTSHSLIDWFLSNRGGTVKGYRRAIYSGFPTIVFADILRVLINDHQELSGLFHVSSEPINKFDLLQLVKNAYGADIEIEPFDDFEIDRSLDSTRFGEAIGFIPPSWPEMIERMAADDTPYDRWRN